MAGMRRNPLATRRTGRPQNASISGGASFSDFSELFGMGAPVEHPAILLLFFFFSSEYLIYRFPDKL